jgi:hypothetical protein
MLANIHVAQVGAAPTKLGFDVGEIEAVFIKD